MVYQDPLAYLLGVEGTALLRAFAGEYDRDFTQARLTEIRCLLDHPALAAEGVSAGLVSTEDGYGTGRHSAHLVELGHRVIGVDSSPDMLDRARERACPRPSSSPASCTSCLFRTTISTLPSVAWR